jgi:hypothetical protein
MFIEELETRLTQIQEELDFIQDDTSNDAEIQRDHLQSQISLFYAQQESYLRFNDGRPILNTTEEDPTRGHSNTPLIHETHLDLPF